MDSVKQFAKEVAPLYVHNNWLGLGNGTLEEAEQRVENLTRELYDHALREFPFGDNAGFVSSGRVIIYFQPYDNDPDEITIGLDVRTLILTPEYGFLDIYDERLGE